MPDLITAADITAVFDVGMPVTPAHVPRVAEALSAAMDTAIVTGNTESFWRTDLDFDPDLETEAKQIVIGRGPDDWKRLAKRAYDAAVPYWHRSLELTYGHDAAQRLAVADVKTFDRDSARLPTRNLRASEKRELDRLEGPWAELADLHDNFLRIGEILMPRPTTTPIPDVPDLRFGDHHAPEFRTYLRTGDETELRAAGTLTGAAGGYAVPQAFRNTVTTTMAAFGGIRRLAEVITTDTGADLPWPTNDDTVNAGGILAENTQVAEQDVTLGQKTLGAYMYTSSMVRASIQLLQDAGFDIEAWLARQLGQRIARGQAAHWVTGTGTAQPQGLLTGTTTGKTAASATAITYDELVDLVHSVDVAYREGGEISTGNAAVDPGVAWVMADTTFGYLRKMRDDSGGAGIGRPLIDPDVRGGLPTTLLGYRIVVDNSMPAIASTASPILFGNIRAGYVIRDIGGVEVLRLTERYADYIQVGFLGYQRSDGLVQDTAAVKKLTMAV